MERYISKHFRLVFSAALVIALCVFFLGVTRAQQFPGLPNIPGGVSVPGVPSGASTGFAGLGALNAAKEFSGQNKTTFPTANIAVSGNHIVIAWPNGVVTVETVATNGTISRIVLGPPTESNITVSRK